MFAVIFEVLPAPGKKDAYLEHARTLKSLLESIDGFIDNERFESKRREGWMLSLSTWRDEKAVVRWRTQGKHHGIQESGRGGIFSDYHLRVCEITSDSRPPLAVVERRFDATEIGTAKSLAVTEISPAPGETRSAASELLRRVAFDPACDRLVDYDVFGSMTAPGKMLLLSSWKTAAAAEGWSPAGVTGVHALRHRRMRNIRDYGMHERREAPQYYPDVARTPAPASR